MPSLLRNVHRSPFYSHPTLDDASTSGVAPWIMAFSLTLRRMQLPKGAVFGACRSGASSAWSPSGKSVPVYGDLCTGIFPTSNRGPRHARDSKRKSRITRCGECDWRREAARAARVSARSRRGLNTRNMEDSGSLRNLNSEWRRNGRFDECRNSEPATA